MHVFLKGVNTSSQILFRIAGERVHSQVEYVSAQFGMVKKTDYNGLTQY